MPTAIIDLSARSPVLPRFPWYGICILESRHSATFEMEPSRYDFSEVMMIMDGSGWVVHKEQRRAVSKGDVVAVEAGESYRFEDKLKAPLSMLSLCIAGRTSIDPILNPIRPVGFSLYRHTGFSREIASDLRTILREQLQVKAAGEAEVVAHTLLLLGKLFRFHSYRVVRSQPQPTLSGVELEARVRFYIDQLETHFHEPESLVEVAHRLGISTRSLTDYFRKLTGVTRNRYLRDLRLRHARYLLAETSHSITSVAFACGFEDLSNFFRLFRAEEKLSPSEWRKKHVR